MADHRFRTATLMLFVVAILATFSASPVAAHPRRLKVLPNLLGRYFLNVSSGNGYNVTNAVLELNITNPTRGKTLAAYQISFQGKVEVNQNITDTPRFFAVFSNGHLYYLNSGAEWTVSVAEPAVEEADPTADDDLAPASAPSPPPVEYTVYDFPATHTLQPSVFTGTRDYFSKKDFIFTDWNVLGCPDIFFRFGKLARIYGLLGKVQDFKY